MEHEQRVVNALKAIEDGLRGKLELARIAEQACFSPFHFHRVFSALVGEPPAAYVRRRRLTRAGDCLLNTKTKIIDIALDWQFQSPEAFARAFARQFGFTPSRYRRLGCRRDMLCREPVTERELRHRMKGDITMTPKFVEKQEIKLVGMQVRHTLKNPRYTALWGKFMPRQGEIADALSPAGYEVCCAEPGTNYADFNENTEFSTMAAVAVKDFSRVPAGMVTRVLPAGKYAVFTHKGPMSAMKMTYGYIFGVWAVSGRCELAHADDFALYDERFKSPESPDNEVDIYIPVK